MDGDVRLWKSARDAERELGVRKGTLNYWIRIGKAYEGMVFSRIGEEPVRKAAPVAVQTKYQYFHEVPYEVKDGFVLMTDCPHMDYVEGLGKPKVGGEYCCLRCRSHRGKNMKAHVVKCSFGNVNKKRK